MGQSETCVERNRDRHTAKQTDRVWREGERERVVSTDTEKMDPWRETNIDGWTERELSREKQKAGQTQINRQPDKHRGERKTEGQREWHRVGWSTCLVRVHDGSNDGSRVDLLQGKRSIAVFQANIPFFLVPV